MIALPTFAPMALEQTYQQLQNMLSFDDTEKQITGEIGLFLNSLDVLDLNQLDASIKTVDRAGINHTFVNGLNMWEQSLNRFTDQDQNTLTLSIGVETDYSDNNRQKFRLCIESSPFAYDIKPLSALSRVDRDVVVRCVAEIRAIFLYCPNVTDLTDFAGYRMETYEFLDEWLPAEVKTAGAAAIEKYIEENQDDFEAYGYEDVDELVIDYVDYLTPMPKWVSELDKGTGKADPFTALKRLKRLKGNSHNSGVIAFLNDTISSITEFLQHFPDLKSWSDFNNDYNDLNHGIETNNPNVDLGYMLAWGEDGFWWNIQSEVFQGMMEAGEEPTFYGWAYDHFSDTAKLAAEKIYRGAALLTQMASLTADIEQNLPKSQNMDNEVKEN